MKKSSKRRKDATVEEVLKGLGLAMSAKELNVALDRKGLTIQWISRNARAK